MFKVLVVSHGLLASELVKAAETIIGEPVRVKPVSIGWNQDVDEARQTIQDALDEADGGGGAIILTDMFGGTPTNISLTFLDEGKVEVITGVNLPMLIKLATLQNEGKGLGEAATLTRDRGKQSIFVASEILTGEKTPGEK